MDIIKAHAVNNLCYIAGQKMTPAGIVVHSTGANNPNLCRYVDCPDEVGVNRYGNHWNTATPEGEKVCVHAFIGYDKTDSVRVAEILPLDICCWGVGRGSKGSYNYAPPYIQFEICEDGLEDKEYYETAFGVAADYCAYLCKKYNLSVDRIIGHVEAHEQGYGSDHEDPEHWMKNFGETMNDFRQKVAKRLAGSKVPHSQEINDASSGIKEGDLVSFTKHAEYYNGGSVPEWVKMQNWYVKEPPDGDRVVIDKNETGTHAICSPVSSRFLIVVQRATVKKESSRKKCPYLVKVSTDVLNIRKGAGTDTEIVGSIADRGVYTIVEEAKGIGASQWGKLKSGAGWISLDYVKEL